ncbi:MAG: flagellar hook protein FlgE [Hyphomicrobiales bacterium]|nr:flagellar hook protein FlgE [Hyphomicrobiales bacterium]
MSVFSAMRTSVSGMSAQAARISTYSDNIANVDTVGYKAASAQFQTMLVNQNVDAYTSGGVDTKVRYAISQQGVFTATNSPTDMAISGQGFFVVSDAAGATHLTRAGSFVLDASGYLVNTAGFRLRGVDVSGSTGATTSAALSNLSDIKINTTGLVATASTSGVLTANLPAGATVVAAANLPSANAASAAPTDKTSIVAYDYLGQKVTLDVYMTKTGPNAWEVAAFDSSTASAGGGFPYSAGPLATANLQFDPTTGALAAGSANSLSLAIPGGATATLDMSAMSQLGAGFSVASASFDGNAPAQFSQLKVDSNGVISAVYQNGKTVQMFQALLANVPSPDNLTPNSGDIFDINSKSGPASVSAPGAGMAGTILSATLENSTVDVANELTGMIETQRAYTANSKAFQVASDITDVLVNLKV